MSESVVVVGAGGHAKVVVSLLQSLDVHVAGIVDDDPQKRGVKILGVEVMGAIDPASQVADQGVLAIGSNEVRQRLALDLSLDWGVFVHPTAWVHPTVELGPGTVIFSGAIVQPDTWIGSHAIVNTGACVDHDCRVGDFSHLAPGVSLAGGVTVGQGTLMGIGSCASPGVEIGDWVTVGAGAAVVRDLAAGVTAVGVPATPLQEVGG